MYQLKSFSLMCLLFAMATTLGAQSFLQPFDGVSRNKPSYITLKDGKELEGTIKKLDRKKGLIEEIKILVDGKKKKVAAEEIQHMYLPASNLAKFLSASEKATDANKWESNDLDEEHLKDGYAYFEFATVQIKRKERDLLLQLVNPNFANGIRVYHDPLARETASIGVAGISVAGGLEKSYYVRKGKETAIRLKKKDYDEQFKPFFGDCASVVKMGGNNPKWADFPQHTYEYNTNCD